uniref:Uncharacterized protein n=1 Tax=Romanomermis culicivorax TaxID=13658 RepID=A0A915JT24_ROMCU
HRSGLWQGHRPRRRCLQATSRRKTILGILQLGAEKNFEVLYSRKLSNNSSNVQTSNLPEDQKEIFLDFDIRTMENQLCQHSFPR